MTDKILLESRVNNVAPKKFNRSHAIKLLCREVGRWYLPEGHNEQFSKEEQKALEEAGVDFKLVTKQNADNASAVKSKAGKP